MVVVQRRALAFEAELADRARDERLPDGPPRFRAQDKRVLLCVLFEVEHHNRNFSGHEAEPASGTRKQKYRYRWSDRLRFRGEPV